MDKVDKAVLVDKMDKSLPVAFLDNFLVAWVDKSLPVALVDIVTDPLAALVAC